MALPENSSWFILTAGCGVMLIVFGLIVLPKRKAKISTWSGRTPAQAYSEMLDLIVRAKEPKDLYKIYGLSIDFRVEFTGKLPNAEIDQYLNDIIELKNERTTQLLREAMGRTAKVS